MFTRVIEVYLPISNRYKTQVLYFSAESTKDAKIKLTSSMLDGRSLIETITPGALRTLPYYAELIETLKKDFKLVDNKLTRAYYSI